MRPPVTVRGCTEDINSFIVLVLVCNLDQWNDLVAFIQMAHVRCM